jgi:hypothetical protein
MRILASATAAVAVGLAGMACSPSAPARVMQSAGGMRPAADGCQGRPGWPRLTLTDTSPAPAAIVKAGSFMVVTVPRWGWGQATDVLVARPSVLREVCTVVLHDHGRRTIFVARMPGATYLGATVEPASNLEMPAWGGRVIVTAQSV